MFVIRETRVLCARWASSNEQHSDRKVTPQLTRVQYTHHNALRSTLSMTFTHWNWLKQVDRCMRHVSRQLVVVNRLWSPDTRSQHPSINIQSILTIAIIALLSMSCHSIEMCTDGRTDRRTTSRSTSRHNTNTTKRYNSRQYNNYL
jgi:hypothetical protein